MEYNYVPNAMYLERLYYNEQVLKFSIHRRILKSHIYIYIYPKFGWILFKEDGWYSYM